MCVPCQPTEERFTAQRMLSSVKLVASEEVVLQLVNKKCIPSLLYGPCLLVKSELSSLDFVVNRFFMKMFRTNNMDIVKDMQLLLALNCQVNFCRIV